MLDGTASITARGVAAQRLGFQRVPADHGRPDDDQALQADVAAGAEVPDNPLARYLQSRTLWFDRAVVDAIAAGITQVVAVGAGYDGRSLRYAKPGVRWYELDHPDTQADKRARLDRLGVDQSTLAFAPVDFDTDDAGEGIAAAGLDPAAPALFTCEGVLVYLRPEAVGRLLRSLRNIAAAGSILATEVPLVPEGEAEQARRAALGERVSGFGEHFTFSLPRAELRTFLEEAGWRVRSAVDPRGVDIAESTLSTAFVTATRA